MERADGALYDSKRAGRNRVTAAWPVDEAARTGSG
jgi:PleD family two-component response regulator